VDTDDAEAHYTLALVLLAVGRSYPALLEANWAIRLRPDYAEALALRATAWLELDNYANAEEDFWAAYQLDPTNVGAVYGVAKARAASGDAEGAIEALETYFEVAPPSAPNYAAAEALLEALKQEVSEAEEPD
jgi:tetratricopeptide (TPR) repeat protein